MFRKAITAVSVLWLGALLGAGLAFAIQVLLARRLAPVGYGVFASSLATITLLGPLAGFGLGGLWLKCFGAEGAAAERWLPASFSYAFLTTVTALSLLGAWAVLGPHGTATRLSLLAMAPVLAGHLFVEVVAAKLQIEERFSPLAVWYILPNLGRMLIVLLILGVWTDPSPVTIATGFAVTGMAVCIVGSFQMRSMSHEALIIKGHTATKHSEDDKIDGLPFPRVIDVMLGAWPFGLGVFFHLIYFQSDIVLLKYISGDEVAGVYNVAFTIMAAVYLLPSSIYQRYLLPKVHRWANHDRARLLHVYRFGNGAMILLGSFAMILVIVLSPWGIPFLFGPEYAKASKLLMVLAFGLPLRFLASSVGVVLVTKDHMRRKNVYMGAVAIVNVLLNLALIPRHGSMGAAGATVASECLLLLLYLVGVRRHVFGADAWRGWTLRL